MEMILKKLFDYQRFEQNEKLDKLIGEAESRYEKALSDDDLDLVNAAGEPEEIQFGGIAERNDNSTIHNNANSGEITGDFTGNCAGKP